MCLPKYALVTERLHRHASNPKITAYSRMSDQPEIFQLSHYHYELPADRIAGRPLEQRDASKLLRFDRSTGAITHHIFRDIPSLLPAGSLLVVNRSRVVAARLDMIKPTGGIIEILLTKPVFPSADPAHALTAIEPSVWECLIGGRNVDSGMDLSHASGLISGKVLSRTGSEGKIELTVSGRTLADVLDEVGHVPLPPYLRREDDESDKVRYQTVFAKDQGSVAAPTAGLHFTESVLKALEERGITRTELTLHVGLGTFKPVEVEDLRQHIMHSERIEVTLQSIDEIIEHLRSPHPYITVVGTTSMRTLESLFWFGLRLHDDPSWMPDEIECEQWSAFSDRSIPDFSEDDVRLTSMMKVKEWMEHRGLDRAWGYTSLMLAPGAQIMMSDALITNFHQPGNTLIMLVAAVAGDPQWRSIYESALENDYRFLSYGDSSLLVRTPITEGAR